MAGQTDSGFGVDALAGPEDSSSPEAPLPVRPRPLDLSWVRYPVLAPSRPSCQEEEGKMGLFLSCGGKLSVPLNWRRVCW